MSSYHGRAIAFIGALIYAAAGFLMGAQNAGWFGLERNANALLPVMGVGAALVVGGFAPSSFNTRLSQARGLGRAAQAFLIAGPAMYVIGSVIGFAIVGTLALGIGLVCLALAVTLRKLAPVIDRVLIILSAVGSVTWNTETVSAFLLVGVGAIWMVLAIRLLSGDPPHSKLGRAPPSLTRLD